jgi:hypothetical protein
MKIDQSKHSVQNSPRNKSPEEEPLEEKSPEELPLEEEQVPENNEISINYVSTREILDRNKIVVDNIFHLKLYLTLPEVMMILNHKPSKDVDVEMIG